MAEGPVLLSDSGSEGGRALPRRSKRLWARRRRWRRPRPAEIIDLTGEDTCGDGVVIDLTGEDEEPPNPARASVQTPPAGMEAEALPGFSAACKDEAETPACSTDSDCSPTTFNSDLSSLASPLLESDRFSLSPSSSDSWGAPVDPGSPPPRSLPATTSKGPSRKRPRLETSTPVPAAVKQEPAAPPTPRLADPSCLHKLRYFRRMPVHHLLRVARDEDGRERTRTWPIPSRKLDLVRTTMEESFPEGTLQFLTDFVTPRHYPPCKITTYLVQQILLGPHHWGILKDAYTLLMKIQTLHPASTATGIGWDWPLLRHIMEDEEKPPGRLLFLQYVVQTLEDDVQLGLRLQRPSMTIAKQVLSCDQSFGNIKEVIGWLVAAVTGVGFCRPLEQQNAAPPASGASRLQHSSRSPTPSPTEPREDVPPGFLAEKVVLLLQRLLSIAVEVDRSPNCSARKIADAIFPSVLNIPLHSSRGISVPRFGAACGLLFAPPWSGWERDPALAPASAGPGSHVAEMGRDAAASDLPAGELPQRGARAPVELPGRADAADHLCPQAPAAGRRRHHHTGCPAEHPGLLPSAAAEPGGTAAHLHHREGAHAPGTAPHCQPLLTGLWTQTLPCGRSPPCCSLLFLVAKSFLNVLLRSSCLSPGSQARHTLRRQAGAPGAAGRCWPVSPHSQEGGGTARLQPAAAPRITAAPAPGLWQDSNRLGQGNSRRKPAPSPLAEPLMSSSPGPSAAMQEVSSPPAQPLPGPEATEQAQGFLLNLSSDAGWGRAPAPSQWCHCSLPGDEQLLAMSTRPVQEAALATVRAQRLQAEARSTSHSRSLSVQMCRSSSCQPRPRPGSTMHKNIGRAKPSPRPGILPHRGRSSCFRGTAQDLVYPERCTPSVAATILSPKTRTPLHVCTTAGNRALGHDFV